MTAVYLSTESSCSQPGRCLLTHQQWWSQQVFHISMQEKCLDCTFWKIMTPWMNVNFCVQVTFLMPFCSVSFVLVSQSVVQPSESYLHDFPTKNWELSSNISEHSHVCTTRAEDSLRSHIEKTTSENKQNLLDNWFLLIRIMLCWVNNWQFILI